MSPCPRWFAKLLKYSMGNLRELMHIPVLLSYTNDIYLQGDSQLECMLNIADTIILSHELDLTLHPDK